MSTSLDHAAAHELLATHAVAALPAQLAAAVDAHVAVCTTCAETLELWRATSDGLSVLTPAAPPIDLRTRTLSAAIEARAGRPVTMAEPLEVHRVEGRRAADLLAELTPTEWCIPAGDAFPGWSVHDLAVHLAATETVLAERLTGRQLTADTDSDPTARAYEAVARHQHLDPTVALDELTRAADVVSRTAAAVPGQTVTDWHGLDLPLDTVLIQRSFELWTHADDVRSVVERPLLTPPPSSLATMSRAAAHSLPLLLAATGADHAGRVVRLELQGPGGGRFTVLLGPSGGIAPDHDAPDATLEVDVVDFCRALADRTPPGGLRHRCDGDLALADDLVASLAGLAGL